MDLADISQDFEGVDMFRFWVDTSGLIVSGGKDGAVIQIDIIEEHDHC